MNRLQVKEFSPEIVPPGRKDALRLDVVTLASGETIFFPTLVARGGRPGRLLVAIGGVHGDEYEGPIAIMDLFKELEPLDMSGTFIGVTVANPPAFEAGSRVSSFDGANLARVFPGAAGGSVSEQIAYHLLEQVIAHADLLVDLHSGGRDYAMPVMSGYYLLDGEVGRISREAAFAFGAETIWASALNRGRSISEAARRGIPAIYAEASGGARINPEDVMVYRAGLLNLLRYLDILPGEPARSDVRYFATTPEEEDWNDGAALADASGLYISQTRVLEEVNPGQRLGDVVDLFGNVLQVVKANRSGRVMAHRIFPRVHEGDALAVIA